MSDIYKGRLACAGDGNLFADESRRVGSKTVTVFDEEGEALLDENGAEITVAVPLMKYGKNHGRPVAFDDGKFIFVDDGEESHNERHEKQRLDILSTTNESAGTKENPTPGQEHHWGVTEDDDHYSASAPNKTKLKFDSDRVAATVTGHTEAWNGK